ncbi:2-oxoacid:acceptor oxidoreductase family protein [Myxococcota bacterium]|nr:2-oxoacid:acceptor oxidoreductase family protein [Myxococcota bacterium]
MSPPLHVVVVGAGGQGVLTTARVLGDAALAAGCPAVVGQVHGMAQRGGSVQSPVVLGAARTPWFPPGTTDLLLALDPLEAARAAHACTPTALAIVAGRGPRLPGTPPEEDLLAAVRARVGRLVVVDLPPRARLAGPVVLGAAAAAGVLPFPGEAIRSEMVASFPAAMAEAFDLGWRAVARGDAAPAPQVGVDR